MSNSNYHSRRRWLFVIIFLFFCIGIGYFLLHRSPVPPTIIIPLSAKLPPNDMAWSYRYIPGSWGWLWRLKSHLSGPPRTILIEADIIDLNNPPEAFLSDLLKGGTELANTNGIRAISFIPSELKNLRQRLYKPSPSEKDYAEILSRPRIATADSIECSLMTSGVGTNQNSFSIQLGAFPRVIDNATDLTTTMVLTETSSSQAKTNFAIWTRSRITNACGLLILDCHPSTTNAKRMAVLISATSISTKK